MNPKHPDPDIQAMIDQVEMRNDMAALPLSLDPYEARLQLLRRQSVPKPLSERIPIVRDICAWLDHVLEEKNPR